MWSLFGFVIVMLLLFGSAVAMGSGYALGRLAHHARRLPGVRGVPLIGVRPSLPPIRGGKEEGADLLAYPRRLAELQDRLVERHRAVQAQLQLLSARRDSVRAKGGRDDLIRKYEADVAMLDRRAESMRRVMGLVWKTHAVLLMRVHLGITARRRPSLGRLPEPSIPKSGFPAATAAWHEAAAQVLFYREYVGERARGFDEVVPVAPVSAEIDDGLRGAVESEKIAVAASYTALAARMDHLADNLTFVGDHFAALAVVDTEPEDLALDGGPAQLLEEVAVALRGLADLASKVDPVVVDTAVSNLADEITHLEEAGLEADAEAAAQIEVDRLLGQFPTT